MTHHQEKCAHCKGAGLVEVFNMGDVCSDCNGIGVAPSPKYQEKCDVVEIKPHDVGTGYIPTEKKSIEEVSAPSPHTEELQQKNGGKGSTGVSFLSVCPHCHTKHIVGHACPTFPAPHPSPHTEGWEEKSRDLWNWVASNMTNPSDIASIRMAQRFGPEFREKIADVLHQTREDTLAFVEKEVIGEMEETKVNTDTKVSDHEAWLPTVRNQLRLEQRQRLKGGGK